jgi:hypothetical protein
LSLSIFARERIENVSVRHWAPLLTYMSVVSAEG